MPTLTWASTKDEGQQFIQEIAGWVAENYAMQLPDHEKYKRWRESAPVPGGATMRTYDCPALWRGREQGGITLRFHKSSAQIVIVRIKRLSNGLFEFHNDFETGVKILP